MSHATDTLAKIQGAVTALGGKNLAATATALIGNIGYTSPKTLAIETAPGQFLTELNIDPTKLAESLPRIKAVHFLFQLTGDELPALSRDTTPQTGASFQRGAIDSFLFLAVDLDDGAWSRRELVTIVRELNRGFAMPAIILFRHGGKATLAVIDRRANRRDPSRDVVGGRISLVKDIDLAAPHRAHVEILADLSLAAIARKKAPADFRDLYDRWIETLSAAELNKRFYAELADWFAWASTKTELVTFPKGQPADEGGKEVGLIRLLTRLMFVWFIKEKGLVTGELFNADKLTTLLNEPPSSHPKGHDFYLAILQNLFFATLNTEMDQRRWRKDEAGQSKDYLGHHVFRHEAKFADANAAESLFNQVPFLNGGLFECLDTEITSPEDERKNRAEKERQRLILRVDGFSDQPDKQPQLQNRIFFGGEDAVDLSKYYEKAVRPRNVSGLIDLFERYKFTIEENTPLEEEAALDPELLGKVFENLLASYNEDTKTTARNKSGSFYTPREVVEFMVDEALLAYLKPKVASPADTGGIRPNAPGLDFGSAPGELGLEATGNGKAAGKADVPDRNEARLRALLDFASRTHDFTPSEVDALIAAIESCKAIDPAVGSGAFPLGLLQKLVHALAVLDPGGEKWKARNRLNYDKNIENADAIPAPNQREAALIIAHAELAKFEASFSSGHEKDYTRKLYLIEGCLHGVDIQPIAVQIAKLRCFISLAVPQKFNKSKGAEGNFGITPLPNLETKLVAANTLTPLHRKGQMELQDPQINLTMKNLKDEFRGLFAAANGAAKRKAQKSIDALIEKLVQLLADDRALSSDEVRLIAQWRPFDQNSFAPFFDPQLMFGLKREGDGYFDIALANPPYVRQEKIESFRINGKPVVSKAQLKADYKTYAGTADLLVYFYERALRLLKPEGSLAFITSNKWYRAGYGKGLRSWLVENARILKLMDFGDAPVFEAIAYPTILIATRRTAPGKPADSDTFDAMNWTMGEPVETFPARFAAESFAMPQKDLAAAGWQMEPKAERDLLAKLRAAGKPLGEWCNGNMFYGIKSGCGHAFEIDSNTRSRLITEHPRSAEIIKPFIKGRDLKRWQFNRRDIWLIFTRHGVNLDDYPAVSKYLMDYREQLEPKPKGWSAAKGDWKGRKGGSYEWFEIQDNVAYWQEFEKPKIVLGRFMDKPTYAFDDTGLFTNDALYIITGVDRYVVGILNSSVSWWFLTSTSTDLAGGFIQALIANQAEIPVPEGTEYQRQTIVTLVKAIEVSDQRPRLESLLNAFVYELFFPEELAARGLSPFAAAREAGLDRLAGLEGKALAHAADVWSTQLADPATNLYATLFDLQSIDAIRIIEGRG